MPPENLWVIPSAEEAVRTPTIALKEQAKFLSRLTEGILSASVSRIALPSSGKIIVSLYIEAPIIDYTIEVLELEHALFDTYPLIVKSSVNDTKKQANSEHELLRVVESILHSKEVQKILRSLLSESQSGTDQ